MVADSLQGGLGAAVSAGLSFLQQRDWVATVLAPGAAPAEDARLLASHRAIPLPSSTRSLRAVRAAGQAIRRAVDEVQPDVVHCHGPRSFVATRLFARQPAVLTLHGTGAMGDDPSGYHLLRRAGLAVLPRVAEVAFSAVPGFDPPWRFAPHASPRLRTLEQLPPPAPDAPFLWLARLDAPKLPYAFVDAIREADRTVPARGAVAGTGPLEAALRAHVDRTGAPVDLLGHRDDVVALLQGCRAVVLLSQFEAVPFAVTEAMWAGRPVIASDLPGTRWLAGTAGPTGLTLTSDVASVTAAMVRLADPDVAAAEGQHAAARIRQLLTADAPWPQVEEAYEAVRAS